MDDSTYLYNDRTCRFCREPLPSSDSLGDVLVPVHSIPFLIKNGRNVRCTCGAVFLNPDDYEIVLDLARMTVAEGLFSGSLVPRGPVLLYALHAAGMTKAVAAKRLNIGQDILEERIREGVDQTVTIDLLDIDIPALDMMAVLMSLSIE